MALSRSPDRNRARWRRWAVGGGTALVVLVWCAAAADVLHQRRIALDASRTGLTLVAELLARRLEAEGCSARPGDLVPLLRTREISLSVRWPDGPGAARCPPFSANGPRGSDDQSATAAFDGGRGSVEVRRPRDAILAEWHASMLNTLARNAVVTVLAAALVLALLRQLRQQDVAHAELSAAEQRWRAVFDTAPVGIVMLPPNTRYMLANPAFQRMLGYSVEELQRLSPDDITHPDDVALTREQVQRLERGEREQVAFVKRYMHRDGHVVWTELSISRLTTPGPLQGILVAVVDDVSSRRAAEQDRQRLEAQLRQSQKLEALGTFAGGIAHDFNNILSAILGYGERALRGVPPDAPAREDLQQVLGAGARARSLVQRILAFSRSGVPSREPVDVNAVVMETVNLVRAALPEGVTLETTSNAPGACILGDATHLHQVVMNLCSNALHAVQGQGRVSVVVCEVAHGAPLHVTSGLLRAGRYVRIEVEDTGVGMPPEVQERMFDPFYTTRSAGEGTGLGLSLVDGIVKDYGGGIEVRSAPGQGTRFCIDLPLAAGVAPPAGVASEALPHGSGEVVLLVDDERTLVALGEELLAELGYEPVGFESAVQALAAFERAPARFDLVLTDHTMPGMTGTAFIERLRELRADLPVVLMSGRLDGEIEARARALGVSTVLSKPVDRAALARALQLALAAGTQRAHLDG